MGFDLVDREGRQVRLVEPVDGDAAFFDTIPPELGLSTWGDFPIVGHDGGRLDCCGRGLGQSEWPSAKR